MEYQNVITSTRKTLRVERKMLALLALVVVAYTCDLVYGSIGEKAYVFLNCFESCVAENCSGNKFVCILI